MAQRILVTERAGITAGICAFVSSINRGDYVYCCPGQYDGCTHSVQIFNILQYTQSHRAFSQDKRVSEASTKG